MTENYEPPIDLSDYREPFVGAKGICTNPTCDEPVGTEFVLQVSTTNIRWFCSMYCAADSLHAHEHAIATSPFPPGFEA